MDPDELMKTIMWIVLFLLLLAGMVYGALKVFGIA